MVVSIGTWNQMVFWMDFRDPLLMNRRKNFFGEYIGCGFLYIFLEICVSIENSLLFYKNYVFIKKIKE